MRKAVVLAALLVAYGLLSGTPDALADGFTFATLPASGDITGPAGSTIGWGYTLTNNSATDWLNTIGINADLLSHAFANALFDFPILAPGTTVSVPYDGLNGFGLYELTWDPDAPPRFVNTGNFDLTVEWWDGDPLGGGNLLQSDVHSLAPYSATVEATNTNAVSEPSTLLSLATGLGALFCLHWERRKKNAVGTAMFQ